MHIEIDLEFGSEFQKKMYTDMFNAFLFVMETKMKEGHKKNKIDISYE